MNRLEWILGILLVVLLVVVIGLAAALWLRPDTPVAGGPGETAADPRQAAIAPTSAFAGQTAQLAFVTAQEEAQRWQSDAQLLSATTTWPQGTDQQTLLSGETTWNFTFHSRDSDKNAVIAVAEGEATLVTEVEKETVESLGEVVNWNLDSKDVMQKFLDEGGARFMEEQGVTALTMVLSTDNENGRLEWMMLLFAPQNGRSLSMRIDATSGEIILVDDKV